MITLTADEAALAVLALTGAAVELNAMSDSGQHHPLVQKTIDDMHALADKISCENSPEIEETLGRMMQEVTDAENSR